MKGDFLTLLFLMFDAIQVCISADTVQNSTSTAAQTQSSLRKDLNKHMFRFTFRVSVELPYKESTAAAELKNDFSFKLFDAFKGSPGLAYINITESDIHLQRTGITSNVTCQYVVSYNASISLVRIRTDIVNRVMDKIESEYFFKQSTVHNFKVNKGEMAALLTAAGNETCKVPKFTPCPPEYVCVDEPYLHCVHKCRHGTNKLTCENGGYCFFDFHKNRTKCSCVETKKYIYSGEKCEQKVEKLALKSTYIIAIAGGGGGGILLILIVVIVVIANRGRAKTSKTKILHDENGYALTSVVRDTNIDDEDNRRHSKLSLDGVSNALYSAPDDTRFLAGRTHAVYKDERGQEIYMYKPDSDREDRQQPVPDYQPVSYGDRGERTPSRQSSFDDDIRTGQPFSYHGDYRQNRRQVSNSYI